MDADEIIDIWEISPHLDASYDCALFSDHTQAIAYVGEIAESLIEDAGEGDEFQITIKHVTMTRHDFEELAGDCE